MASKGVLLVVDRNAEAGGLETLPETDHLDIVDRERFSADRALLDPSQRVCINSEAAMDDVLMRLDPHRAAGIRTLKDKTAFRQMLAPLFPDFTFEEVPMDQLARVDLDASTKYVIKPALGCFGTGVRIVDGDVDLTELQSEIGSEVERNSDVLSADVLSADTLIVEQYIAGDEYAVDMYFDDAGRPRITNIYHHPMPANPAYLHMVYSSSRTVMDLIFGDAIAFLEDMNALIGLSNVPLHCEFRRDGGRLVPIEINAMRFGGMGLANLGWYSHGSNAYRHFVEGTSPDWSSLLANDDLTSVFFIAYNGTDVDVHAMEPDWAALETQFSNVTHRVAFDHRRQLAFGILYAREPTDRVDELLAIEFNDYFVPSTGRVD